MLFLDLDLDLAESEGVNDGEEGEEPASARVAGRGSDVVDPGGEEGEYESNKCLRCFNGEVAAAAEGDEGREIDDPGAISACRARSGVEGKYEGEEGIGNAMGCVRCCASDCGSSCGERAGAREGCCESGEEERFKGGERGSGGYGSVNTASCFGSGVGGSTLTST